MPNQKNTIKDTPITHTEMESIAERYLDLWQDNVKRWATDPDSLEKWVKELGDQVKPTDENTP